MTGKILLSVNALHYTTEDLMSAPHGWEMTRRDAVTLNLDLVQMGVGAETCWKDWPRNEFRIPANKPYTYSFCLRPFNAKTDDIKNSRAGRSSLKNLPDVETRWNIQA